MNTLFWLIAFAAGSAISVQAAVNSKLAEGMGGNTPAAALVSFAVGALALGIIALSRGGIAGAMAQLPSQPLWHFAGGLLGAAAIFSTVLLAPRIGLANLLALVIAGQLLSSLAIDLFGLVGAVIREVSLVKVAGAVVMTTGVFITLFSNSIAHAFERVA